MTVSIKNDVEGVAEARACAAAVLRGLVVALEREQLWAARSAPACPWLDADLPV